MKRLPTACCATLLLWPAACSSGPMVQSGVLHCRHAYRDGDFVGFLSFEHGELPVPLADASQVDLVYYFDGDDCSRGALMGRDDRPGYLFLVGNRSWDELAGLQPPAAGAESPAAIAPLTKAKHGLAFWLRTGSGAHFLVRIVGVQEASHSDLVAGAVPALRLEWLPHRP